MIDVHSCALCRKVLTPSEHRVVVDGKKECLRCYEWLESKKLEKAAQKIAEAS